MTDTPIKAVSDVEVDERALDESVERFAVRRGEYYSRAFRRIA